ncbi:hypothetical protein MMIC_P0769 [Mariprofundus micogutta]|uniref:Uncharacterized protein n=1 Tax=Mariprofundus micogutta TaxID=1921010 RepID=A0A1L8CLN5_9PROT|nr:hypothetical protein [Mariprofundus micogutta]GAV19811.1 hypothetical protein MMIC_P0769 [Mariprofundus micogutta]
MLRVKVSGLNYQYQQTNRLERERSRSDWEIERVDAPFECYTVHINSCGKLNEVTSVDDVAERFLEGGGKIVRNKLTIPGVGSLISCEDTVGHVFSFIEED